MLFIFFLNNGNSPREHFHGIMSFYSTARLITCIMFADIKAEDKRMCNESEKNTILCQTAPQNMT